jgi:POT family proton-dependent oligopeptide transporter
VTALSFVVCAHVEGLIEDGERPSVWWQILSYAIITAGEVLVSITALEFFYSQGPRKMKSAIMSIKMFAVSVGNGFTALVNVMIQNDDGTVKLSGPAYYMFFVAVMSVAAVLFVAVAYFYQVKSYMQQEEPA